MPKNMNTNKMDSNSIWFIVLIVILLLVFGCAIGLFCRRRKRNLVVINKNGNELVSNGNENFENQLRDNNYSPPQELNKPINPNRFFNYSNIGCLTPTDPPHVDNEVLSTALLDTLEEEEYISPKKKAL